MAILSNFIYCINAERTDNGEGNDGNINAIGIMSAITPEFVPGTFSFSIIFTVLDVDTTKNNTVQVIFKQDSEENSLADTGIVTVPPMPDRNITGLPDEYKGMNMSMDLRNVIFESEGLYTTKVIFNGTELGSKSIYVKGKRTQ